MLRCLGPDTAYSMQRLHGIITGVWQAHMAAFLYILFCAVRVPGIAQCLYLRQDIEQGVSSALGMF